MSEQTHEQRMNEILQHEQDYRQHDIWSEAKAHDDIDYLYTRVNLLTNALKHRERLLDVAYGLLCNSEPDKSLDASYQEFWRMSLRELSETYHAIEKTGGDE